MTILLQWLVENAWLFYIVCAGGAIAYIVRALTALRQRKLALFTLERETATSRMIRAWAMVVVFMGIGAVIFLSVTFVVPGLPIYEDMPTATPTLAVGIGRQTPGVALTPSPTAGLPTPVFTSTVTGVAVPTPPPPDTPTPEPTEVAGGIAGQVNVRFGDFAELVGYSLPGVEVVAAQPLQLTLTWRALEGAVSTDYVVFTHLQTDDGTIVAQHDGPPAGGARPTTGWSAGEIIVDLHPMSFYDSNYTGSASITVGLYDHATGRVLTSAGGDHVVLPVTINVISP